MIDVIGVLVNVMHSGHSGRPSVGIST